MPRPIKRLPLQLPAKTWLTLALFIGLTVSGVSLFFALSQPWLGLELALAEDDPERIVIEAATGPSAHLPIGAEVTSLEADGKRLTLEPLDLITEPDGMMKDYAEYDRFLSRQHRLRQLQDTSSLRVLGPEGEIDSIAPVAAGRPLSSLPPDFWVQVLVGFIAWMVSASVFIFRSSQTSARYLLLSGASTLVFTTAAASYTTRELGYDGTLFRWVCDINFLGGSIFTASFVALLLYYPRRIAPRWAGRAVVALFAVWFILQEVGAFESMTFARRFLVMLGVLSTFVLAGIQWWGTRKEPLARASLQWFLLSWLLGTSLFATFILLPQMFGVDTSPIQGYAFSLFLLVYGGLAFGILRFRLFEIGDWWRGILIWTGSVLFLVLLDMLFLYGLRWSTETSFSLALLISGAIWLPLRGWFWRLITGRRDRGFRSHFDQLMKVAVSPSEGVDLNTAWIALLKRQFAALEVDVGKHSASAVTLARSGLELLIPALPDHEAVTLRHASEGRRLYNQRDVAEAGELRSMLLHILDSLDSYRKGILEERKRIARDVHDNTMGNLLSALHQGETTSKDDHIRNSIRELREIINDHPVEMTDVQAIVQALENDCLERSRGSGLAIDWDCSLPPHLGVNRAQMHALSSIIREALTNTLKHAQATRFSVSLSCCDNGVELSIEDNGHGLSSKVPGHGHGLQNIKSRITELGGKLTLTSTENGTTLNIFLPTSHQ
ncbi:MAG: ATP-binding protein [Verrucomicrobiota bacterium JB023]|nr:ATP-binding protein [Verrucomicrobiota bacterium JB023]